MCSPHSLQHLVAHFNAVKPCDQLNFTPRVQVPLCFMYMELNPNLKLWQIKFLGKKGWFGACFP